MTRVLGYWCIRGLGEHIRTMLHHAGVPYQEKTYFIGPPPAFDRSEWLHDKQKLDLKLPNLPYYIDGDLKLTESNAITRHIARNHGLYGDTDRQKTLIDTAEGVMNDQFRDIVKIIKGNTDFDNAKKYFVADLSKELQKLSIIIGDGDYIAGSKISFADFMMLEMLDRYLAFDSNCCGMFPRLQEFQTRMLSQPGIKDRRESDQFMSIKTRFYGPWTNFGNGIESYQFEL